MDNKICRQTIYLLLTFIPVTVLGESLSFEEVWNQITTHSPAHQVGELQVNSLELSKSRAQRHWWPRLYMEAKSYRTNNPSQSFMGLLEQRKVSASDFVTENLNNPDSAQYSNGVLGVDLSLYEGGARLSQVSYYEHSLKAEKLQSQQADLELYAVAAQNYASLAVEKKNEERLTVISKEISKLLRSYQLGQKSNPVGYSGLLGMKSLANRIEGLLGKSQSQVLIYVKALANMGLSSEAWQPEISDSIDFVNQYLSANKIESKKSFRADALFESSEASLQAASIEKSKLLPRLGVFAENYLFQGERNKADSYNLGIYLHWNLFDPADLGKHKEAYLNAKALAKQAEAIRLQDLSEGFAAEQAEFLIKKNIYLMRDSDKLLGEQQLVATQLFKNGSINALQLIEIINRRVDLVCQILELELGLVKSAAAKVAKEDFLIPIQSKWGGPR